MVVDRGDLPRANGWLQTVEFAGNGLVGPALGGVLFAAAAAAPFAVDAVSFAGSALLLATLPGRFRAAAPEPPAGDRGSGGLKPSPPVDRGSGAARPTLRADIAEGVRWLLGHRVLRTICWLLAVENLVEMAGLAMLVLLAQDVLGLDARGYGLLLACLAVGGVLGGAVTARLHRRLGDQGSVVGSILLMSAGWALLAATSLPVVAGAAVALYGLAAVWWNVVTISFRQAVVPERLQGPGQQRLPAGQLGHPLGRRRRRRGGGRPGRPPPPVRGRRGRDAGAGPARRVAARPGVVRGRPGGRAAVPSGGSGLTDRPGIAATLPRSRTDPGAGRGGVAQR